MAYSGSEATLRGGIMKHAAHQKTPDFADLERIAKAKAVSVYFERRALAEGRPHIHIKTRGMTLASFRNEADAVHWLKGGRP